MKDLRKGGIALKLGCRHPQIRRRNTTFTLDESPVCINYIFLKSMDFQNKQTNRGLFILGINPDLRYFRTPLEVSTNHPKVSVNRI